MTLAAGEAILKVLALRNPTQAELDRLLMPIKPPEIAEEEWRTGLTAENAELGHRGHEAEGCSVAEAANQTARIILLPLRAGPKKAGA